MNNTVIGSITLAVLVVGYIVISYFFSSSPFGTQSPDSASSAIHSDIDKSSGVVGQAGKNQTKYTGNVLNTFPAMNQPQQESFHPDPALADSEPDFDQQLDEDDMADEEDKNGEPDDPYFPPTIVGKMLAEHMILSEEIGPDAEENYQRSLDQLRENPEEAVALLSSAYMNAKEEAYLDRWKMVDTVAMIEATQSLRFLSEIAQSEVPEELYPGVHGFSSKSEELMIRHAAINGIKTLAQNGDYQAEKMLLNLTQIKEKNIKEGAVLAYLDTGGDKQEKKQQLQQELPEEDHWMLELKEVADANEAGPVQTNVSNVPHSNADSDPKEISKEESLPPEGIPSE